MRMMFEIFDRIYMKFDLGIIKKIKSGGKCIKIALE